MPAVQGFIIIFLVSFAASGRMATTAQNYTSSLGQEDTETPKAFHENPRQSHTLSNSVWTTVKGSMRIGDAPGIFRGREAHCAVGHFIVGFAPLTEPKQGSGDDTALNAIKFLCSDGKTLRSAQGKWGEGDTLYKCFSGGSWSPLADITLRMEPTDGTDATGMVNMRTRCDFGAVFEANDYEWGTWVEPATGCGMDLIFCGFATFLQRPQGNGDDLALVGLDMACCPKK